MKKICCLLISTLLIVFALSSCQALDPSADDTKTPDASEAPALGEATTKAPVQPYEEGLYEVCDFVLSTEQASYPADVSYIDVIVTAVEAGCEVNYGGSYDIFRLEDGKETFLCYGGGDVGCILIPDDENSFAKGTLRINLDPIREYQGIEFTPGTYRVHIDDKTIDIVLETP